MAAVPILFVDHATALGGAEIGLLVSLQELDRERFEPHLATRPGRLADAALSLRIAVHDVALSRLKGHPGAPLRLARGVRQIAAVIRRHRTGLVVGNTVRASTYAALAARLTGRPFVWHVQDILPRNAYLRFMSRTSSAVIAVSAAVARSLPRDDVRVVHHGVCVEEFAADRREQAERLRAAWGVPARAVLLGNVARLQPWKGQRDVIAAAESLRDLDNVYVAIVGGDIFADARRYERELEESVRRRGLAGRVFLTGHQDDMPTALQALDVAIHASDNEPFGRVLIEAGAAAVPVVAYASGAVPEIVVHESTGLLVPPSDVTVLGASLRRLALDVPLARSLGGAARERVRAKFDATRMVRRTENVFAAAIAAGRRSDSLTV